MTRRRFALTTLALLVAAEPAPAQTPAPASRTLILSSRRQAGWCRPFIVALTAVVTLAAGAVTPAAAQELTLSVAISMKEAIETLGRSFTARRSGLTLRYNFGASGDLQKQIEAGAPIDVFVSAATRQMDELEQKGLILPDTRRAFARNVLVVVKPTDSRLDLTAVGDLLDPRVTRVAIGNPKTVPAGQYAQESLRAVGAWERLGPKLVFGENVRQVLEYVARGEVDAAFVYATDVSAAGPRVRTAFRPGEETYPPVVYPVAVVAGSRQVALARAFVELVTGAEGQAVLQRLGFQPPAPSAR
jgi:molybdate transport system substrate-binding protein